MMCCRFSKIFGTIEQAALLNGCRSFVVVSDFGSKRSFVFHSYKARDVVATIKAPDSAHRSLTVIILTQASDWATVQRFMKLGVDAHLFKGHFVPSEVVEKVHRVLESRTV